MAVPFSSVDASKLTFSAPVKNSKGSPMVYVNAESGGKVFLSPSLSPVAHPFPL